nr:hypothetical protein BaRGS_024245 [Batillaria attramentaria]
MRNMEDNKQKIQTFLNTCIRRIFNIRWPEKIRNEELWERAGQEPVTKQILRRKAWRVVLDAGFLRVCPIQPHFLRRICLAAGSCPARSHSSSFRIFSGHRMLKMRLRQAKVHKLRVG